MDYLDGNAAARELSKIFAIDVTAAEGQCAHCGTKKRFAEAHVYMQGPGVVARCVVCWQRAYCDRHPHQGDAQASELLQRRK